MLELETAREKILSALQPLPSEIVPLSDAAGRILARPIHSSLDLPGFDNSAMDGYAVRAADVSAASMDTPVSLRLLGRVAAGDVFAGQLEPGTCVRLFTGSPLPAGADAVVMQEDTRVTPDDPRCILVCDGARPWENLRLRGEDVKCGSLVADAGDRINAGLAALLAALGVGRVNVARQPVVGLLATGNELVEAGAPLAPGQIYESNRTSLRFQLAGAGAQPKVYPLVPDTLAATEEALRRAFAECDAVVTSGGVSVGELDFVKAAFEQLGGSLEFWKVAIKPGKPFVFGRWREKFLFGLPGNPVSAFVTCLLLVRPALLRWQGATRVEPSAHPAFLAEPLTNAGDRRHFIRVKVNDRAEVRLAGAQASHVVSALAAANGLVEVPPRTKLSAGALVMVLQMDG